VVLEGILDKATEIARLSKELAESQKFVLAIQGKLANESFVSRAKPEVVEAEREKLANQEQRARQIQETLTDLG
jgi:valyl-tRNA synthetase